MHHNRKQLIVDRNRQRKAVFSMTIVPTVALTATIYMVGVFCSRLVVEAQDAAVELPSITHLFMTLACFVLICEVTTIYQAVVMSHKITGPLTRVRRSVAEAVKGNYSARVKLRKADLVHEYAEEVNQLLELLQQRVAPRNSSSKNDSSDNTISPDSSPQETHV
jgi:signal transduction histidine kinase